MKVKALMLGYYGETRRREGDVFIIKDKKDFSKVWMIEVNEKESKEEVVEVVEVRKSSKKPSSKNVI